MPIYLIRVLAFDGPNVRGPRPGVLLQAHADRDWSRRLRAALKDAAQGAGVVIGGLEVAAEPDGARFVITADFSTPTPALGAAVAQYVVEGMSAAEAGDESWDAEGRLWDLGKRRRAEALPVAALQVQAEAASRRLPAFVHGGRLQVGYGARGFALDLAPLRAKAGSALAPDDVGVGPPPFARSPESLGVPWDRLGTVPVVAVAGGEGAEALVAEVAAALAARGLRVAARGGCGFDAARDLLADPAADAVVVGLEPVDLLRRGSPFDRCASFALAGLPDHAPEGAAGRAELARALGVPLLLTEPGGVAALAGGAPEVDALAAYAPCPLVPAAVFAAAAAGRIR